jgi:predicted DCC family thiol-disulfide oxidoreductase YuxK
MVDNAPEMIFYDGHCGLCHGFVKFVLRRDPDARFHFAPLQSSRFESTVEPARREKLPDSVVVLTREGKLLTRSAASLHVMKQLGGGWRVLAAVGYMVPRFIRDIVYNLVARVRRRLFKIPDDACPIVPPELRVRFES